jgi:diphosphomevalonate decarboxylase
MDYTNTNHILDSSKQHQGTVAWRSPSNLALIKYWGKHGDQLPNNPSISFTLERAYTETAVDYAVRRETSPSISLELLFDGAPNEAFRSKIAAYLERMLPFFPFLRQLHLCVRTKNSFPHGAGIASSASGMSALALCLCSMDEALFGNALGDKSFDRKASYMARLGSGSACRSIFPTMAVWGQTTDVNGSSDEYAVPFADALHPVFANFHNAIMIASKGEKSVSSRAGHALMDGNIYAENRYQQARQRLYRLLGILRAGDLEGFQEIVEDEALTLHALMMASTPSYILLKPNTLRIIDKVKSFRADTGAPICFSLDAGPNPHILYPDSHALQVEAFLASEITPLCENGEWIADRVGNGPLQIV